MRVIQMNTNVNETRNETEIGPMADMLNILRMNNWQGRTARVLLSADIILWSLLIYFIIDYQLFFAS